MVETAGCVHWLIICSVTFYIHISSGKLREINCIKTNVIIMVELLYNVYTEKKVGIQNA